MNILKKLYIGLVLNISVLTFVIGQNPCSLNPDPVIDCDTVSITPTVSLVLSGGADCFEPVNNNFNAIDVSMIVDDFTAVSSMEISFSFDPTQYEYVSSPAGGLTDKVIDDTEKDNGILRFIWNSMDGNGYCLDNGAIIANLRFLSKGSCEFLQFSGDDINSSATITYNAGGEDCVREINFISEPFGTCLLCDGVIVSNAVDAKPTINVTGPEIVDQGDLACYDFTMSDFNSVSSISFAMNYNPQVLEYVSVTNGFLPVEGQPFNSTNADIGILSMVWFNNSGAGVCADPDEVLFTVCFNIVGDLGEETTITLIDFQTTVIEVGYSVNIAFPSCKADNLCLVSPTIEVECADLFFNWSACSESSAGANDASIVISPCGGVPPYTICIPGMPSISIPNVMEGEDVLVEDLLGGTTYTVLIKDSAGSPTYQTPVTPGIAPPIMIEVSSIEPSCATASNGSIEITNITGGVPFSDGSYEITWSNGIYNTLNNTSLANGDYSVSVSDEEGCTIIQNITIDKRPIEVDIEVVSNPSCLIQGGQGDGVLKITVSGGTPPYQFNCSGVPETNCFNITNAQPGEFDFIICDANNCQVRDTIVLEADLQFDLFIKDFCNDCGGEGGSISVGVSIPGVDQNDVNVIGNLFSQTTGASFPTGTLGGDCIISQSPLPADTYTLIVDSPSLDCADSYVFDIGEFNAITYDIDVTQPGCDGESGKIEISNVEGAIDVVEYIWMIPGETGPSVCDLSEGNYRVTITDGRCKRDTIITIEPGGDADVEANCTPATCDGGGSDGTLSAVVSGSFGANLDCVWTELDGTFVGNGNDISNVSQGTYIVICSDMSSTCMVTDTCVIENADAVVLDLNAAVDPSCIDLDSGSIWVNAPTTNIPVVFAWEGPNNYTSADSSMITGLECGVYSVTVTDATGCESVFSHELNCPPEVTVEITVIEPVTCEGPDSGKALAVASGGTTMSGNYAYLFSAGPPSNGPLGTGIQFTSGTQWVIACDAECCSDTVFFEVPGVQMFNLDDTATILDDVACFGESNGSALLVATGGDDPYEYIWSIDNFNGDTRNDLSAGEYEINIIDSDGCENLDTIIINEPEVLVVAIDALNTNNISCNGDLGNISLDVTGGTPPYMYEWTNDVSISDQATGLAEGDYCVTVSDSNLCETEICHSITMASSITATMNVPDIADCFGGTSCISVQAGSVSGGAGGNYTFSVDFGAPIAIDSCLEVFAKDNYTIIIYDEFGCSFETSVAVLQPDPVLVDLGDDPPAIELGDSLTMLTAMISSNLPIIDISWNEAVECLDTAFCNEVLISPSVPTLYSVTVTDENGCQGFDDVFVDISDVRNVFTANVMSQSSVTGNDEFRIITGKGIEDIETFLIYDRWGNKMFESSGLRDETGSEAWDGRFNGQRVNPGVYVYYARVSFIDDRVIEYKGSITVLR